MLSGWEDFADSHLPKLLLFTLEDEDEQVRAWVAQAMGKLGNHRASGPLLAAAREDEHVSVRWLAARSLLELGDYRTEGLLLELLQDKQAGIRLRATELLGMLGAPGAVSPLIHALKDSDRQVRRKAAAALGKLGDRRAVAPLIQALTSSEVSDCDDVVAAPGTLGDSRAVEPLIRMLTDHHRDVRIEIEGNSIKLSKLCEKYNSYGVIVALGRLGEAGIEPLIQVLGNLEKDTYQQALTVLQRLRTPQILNPFSQGVETRQPVTPTTPAIEKVAVNPRTVASLIQALQNPDPWIRVEALHDLKGHTDPDFIESVILALKDPESRVRRMAALVLQKHHDSRTIGLLIRTINDSNKDAALAAISALQKLADPRAVEPLIHVMKSTDSDKEIVIATIAALVVLADPRAVEPLVQLLKDQTRGDSAYFNKAIIQATISAMKAFADSRALNPLIRLLKAGNNVQQNWLRRSAAEALMTFDDPRVIEPLINILRLESSIATQKFCFIPEAYDMLNFYFNKPHSFDVPGPLIKALKLPREKQGWKMALLRKFDDPRAIAALKQLSIAEQACKGERVLRTEIAALDDNTPKVRLQALKVLADLGDAKAIGPISTSLA